MEQEKRLGNDEEVPSSTVENNEGGFQDGSTEVSSTTPSEQLQGEEPLAQVESDTDIRVASAMKRKLTFKMPEEKRLPGVFVAGPLGMVYTQTIPRNPEEPCCSSWQDSVTVSIPVASPPKPPSVDSTPKRHFESPTKHSRSHARPYRCKPYDRVESSEMKQCPICFGLFPESKLEVHASNCQG